jgi:hypothetical protein
VEEERFFSSCLALAEKFGSGERGEERQWWCGGVVLCRGRHAYVMAGHL